jgi:hypothetical protein
MADDDKALPLAFAPNAIGDAFEGREIETGVRRRDVRPTRRVLDCAQLYQTSRLCSVVRNNVSP